MARLDFKDMNNTSLLEHTVSLEKALKNPNQCDYGLLCLFASRDMALDELSRRSGISRDKVYLYYKIRERAEKE